MRCALTKLLTDGTGFLSLNLTYLGDHEALKADHTRRRLMSKSPLRASSCMGKFQKQVNSICIILVENNGTLSP